MWERCEATADAAMGIFLALGKLRMKCPFCGKPGHVGGSRHEGMRMKCDECGLVHGSGFCGLRLVAEPFDESDSPAPSEAEDRETELFQLLA